MNLKIEFTDNVVPKSKFLQCLEAVEHVGKGLAHFTVPMPFYVSYC